MKPDIWESLEALEGQHWVTNTFKGRGDLEFSGQLRFSGEWTGTVHSGPDGSTLFVLAGAIICGRIRVDEITVVGSLQDVDVEVRVFRALRTPAARLPKRCSPGRRRVGGRGIPGS